MSGRTVTVKLSAEVTAYLQAMTQAEQATSRVADAANRLSDIKISADSSVASDLDTAASSADSAAGSFEEAGSSAQLMSSNLDQSGISSRDFSESLSTVGAQSQDAAGAMMAVGDSASTVSSNLNQSGIQVNNFEQALSTVGAQSQDAAGAMLAVGDSATTVSSSLDGSGTQLNNFDGALSSVGAQSQTTANQMLALGASSQQTQGGFQNLLDTAGSMRSEFNQVGASMAVIGGGMSALVGSLIATGIQYNTLQQVAGRALETMTGSASEAADQMDRLHEFADTSPFARQIWITAQQQLMAFGMEAERVVPTLEGVQNAVAAIGGGEQEIAQLVDILGSVEGQGRITGRELQRMGQMGINAADLMGEALGMTGAEIREQITAGALDAETAITALTDGMMTNFEGAAQGLRETMPGAIDRVSAAVRDLGGLLATPLVDPSGGGFLVDATNQVADFIRIIEGLPAPVQYAAAGLTGIVGLGALAGGGFLLLAPRIAATKDALQALGVSLPGVSTGLRNVGRAAGITGAAFVALEAIRWVNRQFQEGALSADELTSALSRAAVAGETANEAFQGIRERNVTGVLLGGPMLVDEVNDIVGAFEILEGSTWDVAQHGRRMADEWWLVGDILSFVGSDVRESKDAFAELDTALAQMVMSGNLDEAVIQTSLFADQMDAAGHSGEDLSEYLGQTATALRDYATDLGVPISRTDALQWALTGVAPPAVEAAEAARDAADGIGLMGDEADDAEGKMGPLAQGVSGVADAAESAASGLNEMLDSMRALGLIQRDALDAQYAYESAVREVEGAVEAETERQNELKLALEAGEITRAQYNEEMENTTLTLDASTEAGERNHQILSTLGDAIMDVAAANLLNGDSVEDVADALTDQTEAWIENAVELGATREQAEALVNAYMGINPELDLTVESESLQFAKDLAEAMGDELDGMEGVRQMQVETNLEEAMEAVSQFEDMDWQTTMDILGDPSIAEQVIWDFENGEYMATADIDGNVDPAADVMAAFLNRDWETVAAIMGQDDNARDTMRQFLDTYWETDIEAAAQLQNARQGILGFTGTPWTTTVTANANTAAAERALNYLARNRSSTLTVHQATVMANQTSSNSRRPVGYARGGRVGRAPSLSQIGGGMSALPGYSNGGRLPHTGLGVDQILGIDYMGRPVARVDDGEFVTRRVMTEKHLPALWAINNDDERGLKAYVNGLADGGLAGRARSFAPGEATSPAAHARYAAEAAMQSSQASAPGVSFGNVTIQGGDTDQVLNRFGDTIFRRLNDKGVHVGAW